MVLKWLSTKSKAAENSRAMESLCVPFANCSLRSEPNHGESSAVAQKLQLSALE